MNDFISTGVDRLKLAWMALTGKLSKSSGHIKDIKELKFSCYNFDIEYMEAKDAPVMLFGSTIRPEEKQHKCLDCNKDCRIVPDYYDSKYFLSECCGAEFLIYDQKDLIKKGLNNEPR